MEIEIASERTECRQKRGRKWTERNSGGKNEGKKKKDDKSVLREKKGSTALIASAIEER